MSIIAANGSQKVIEGVPTEPVSPLDALIAKEDAERDDPIAAENHRIAPMIRDILRK